MSDATVQRPTHGWVLSAHGGPDVLRFEERETVPPGPGEVLLDIEVSGVNFGDTMIRRGEYLRDQPLSFAPGCEAVGRVVAVGPDTEREVGTRVAAWIEMGGAYADRVIVEGRRTYVIPEDVPAGAACTAFLQGTTADYAVHRYGRTQPGEWVLVHGASGGVGSLVVQLAKLHGAKVIGTASTEDKRQVALDQGADVAVDSRDPDNLTACVKEITDGRGADVVVDGVGGPLFMPSLRGMAFRGRYVIAGSASQQPAMLDARFLLPRTQTVVGFILARIEEEDPGEPQRSLSRLCALIVEGKLKPLYDTMPLAEAPDAHRRLEGRTLVGKIVLAP